MTTTNTNLPLHGGHGGGGGGGGHIGRGYGRHRGGYGRGGGWFPRAGGYYPGGYNSCGSCCPFGGGRIWANVRGVLGRKKAPAAQPPAPASHHAKPAVKRP